MGFNSAFKGLSNPKISCIYITFDSHSIPTAHMMHMTTIAIVPTILTSLMPPSTIFRPLELNRSFRESQKPMVFIDAATVLANAKTMPMEAPNSGPSEREMM
jgi:hypothetical protein